MIVKKTVVEPERRVERVDYYACDICGRHGGSDGRWPPNNGLYDVDDVTVKVEVEHKKGDAFPEGEYTETFAPDICPTCFRDKVIPALYALGLNAEVKYRDTGWS
jgi:hypothetical protein